MAKVTNALTTYGVVGNREDLSNIIYNIDPTDTPVMSAIGRRKAKSRTIEWQTEALPAVNLSNKQIEGDTLSRAASTVTVRPTNTCQISWRDATVTGSQEASDAAGKTSEMARQMAIASKALKRDMESILCQNQQQIVGDDAGPVARGTRALEHWIQTNVSTGAGYAFTTATAALTDGTQRAFTETLLNAALQLAYTNGGEPTLILVGPAQKRVVSSFAGRTGTQVPVALGRIQAATTMYASDFGDLKIVPTRFNRNRTALLLDPEFAKLAFFRNFKQEQIGKIGDADTKMILAEWGAEVGNEKAHGKVADLT